MGRQVTEINAGSMADIAFLLLIFFLVTTTMDSDFGLLRRLPPPPENIQDEKEKVEIKERNLFVVLVNANDQLLVEGGWMNVNELRGKALEFLLNAENSELLPEKELLSYKKEKALKEGNADEAQKIDQAMRVFGDLEISKGIISLQNDRGTSYGMYISVQNELAAAINTLRDRFAKEKYGKVFDKITEDQQDLIKIVYPVLVSEAEPKNIGGTN